VFPIEITDALRQSVLAAIKGIRRVSEEQSLPEATVVRGRCVECEFANYCADVW
jgi:CRISPR/Cas system-associated exonuclease Cas4 (RecB family)